MRKIIIIFISALFTLTTSAFAGGMVGVKLGYGDLEGNAKAYTAGSNDYAAQSGSKDSEFGAIFAEVNVKESPISVGIEYVPFDADISLQGHQANVFANVSDYTTIYAMAKHEFAAFGVYVKAGFSEADIGAVKPNDGNTTIDTQSSTLEGTMYGFGLQSKELPYGLVARAEYTLTDFDNDKIHDTHFITTKEELYYPNILGNDLEKIERIDEKIREIIKDTKNKAENINCYPDSQKSYEMLGMDVMLDDEFKIKLLEINHKMAMPEEKNHISNKLFEGQVSLCVDKYFPPKKDVKGMNYFDKIEI